MSLAWEPAGFAMVARFRGRYGDSVGDAVALPDGSFTLDLVWRGQHWIHARGQAIEGTNAMDAAEDELRRYGYPVEPP